ncbi:MAG: hypothetical protein LBL31_04685 [Spirochaetaceae bacterium]|jgi:hypothetical protein|nr:hypothetical protein [Spirochaetaceae bacterium]
MTKLKLTRALFLGAIVLGLFLAGCDTGLPSSEADSQASDSGTGTVTLNVGLEGIPQPAQGAAQGAALTVYPVLDEVTYEADFKAAGGGAVDLLGYPVNSGPQKVTLANGTYTVTVTAYRGTGETDEETGAETRAAIADKKLSNVKVQTNADTNAVFLLKPKTGDTLGTGKFIYSITVPETLATGTLVIGTDETDLANAAGEPVEGDVDLEPGIYSLRVTLTRGLAPNVEYAGFSETLYIYSGLTSTLPEALSSFGDGDFSTPVELPVLDFVKPEARVNVADAFIAPTGEYTGTITWTEDGTLYKGAAFKGEKTYVATVKLTANDGYTFTGIGEDAVLFEESDEGVDVTTANDAGNGRTLTVTATFAETPPALVAESLLALPKLIDLPVVLAAPKPVLTVPAASEAEFTIGLASLAWTSGPSLIEVETVDVYDGAAAYKATYTLTAKAGFTFNGLEADAFSYAGAEEVTNPAGTANTIAVTIEFPETGFTPAQAVAEAMGLPLSVATGPYEVNVSTNQVATSGTAVPATVDFEVSGTATLTLADGTLTVAKKLAVGATAKLAAAEGSKFATTGTGVIDVQNADSLRALAGAAGSALAVYLSDDVTVETNPLVIGNGLALTVADGKKLTLKSAVSGGKSITADFANSSTGSVVLDAATPAVNGGNFEWAVSKAAQGLAADSGKARLTIDVNADAVLGDNSTTTVKLGTAVEGTGDLTVKKTLNVSGKAFAPAALKLGTTGTAVIGGSGSNKVTLSKADLVKGTADGTAGTLTLINEETLTLADTGSIKVEGQGKLATLHAEFGLGTYTAAGEVEIAAKTAGDEIKTAATAGKGLILGGNASSTTALKLLTSDASAATYTLKAVSGGNIRIAGNNITVGHATDLATDNASNIAVPAKGSIVLGNGRIDLGGTAFLEFATGTKIGVFTNSPSALAVADSLGGAVLSVAALSNESGTLTSAGNAKLTSPTETATAINAVAEFVDNS